MVIFPRHRFHSVDFAWRLTNNSKTLINVLTITKSYSFPVVTWPFKRERRRDGWPNFHYFKNLPLSCVLDCYFNLCPDCAILFRLNSVSHLQRFADHLIIHFPWELLLRDWNMMPVSILSCLALLIHHQILMTCRRYPLINVWIFWTWWAWGRRETWAWCILVPQDMYVRVKCHVVTKTRFSSSIH